MITIHVSTVSRHGGQAEGKRIITLPISLTHQNRMALPQASHLLTVRACALQYISRYPFYLTKIDEQKKKLLRRQDGRR